VLLRAVVGQPMEQGVPCDVLGTRSRLRR
jgi:hypothetical protein